jgi:hypothetical protein
LHNTDFGVKAVLWLYDEVNDDWMLVIAADAVDSLGSREMYLKLARHISGLKGSDFQLLRIELVSPQAPLIKALRSVFGSAASVEGARLQNTMVNGITVPNAYLYEVHGETAA